MKVIILAAGLGTRLNELGKSIPKCLIELNKKTLLESKIELLKGLGINEKDILVVIGNQGECWTEENKEKIRKIVKNIVVNYENAKTNNSYSLRLGFEKIDKDDVVVIDGDVVFSSNLIKRILESKKSVILTKKSIKEEPGNKVITDERGKILKINRELKSDLVYGGILKVKKEDMQKLKKMTNKDKYYSLDLGFVLEELIRGIDIYNIIDNEWVNINTPEDFKKAESILQKFFVLLMNGYTLVGKSTMAQELSNILGTDIFHSAIIRKEIGLTPETKEKADKFFDYRTGLREEVDRKVYEKLAESAVLSLKKRENVILDGSYPFNWQRKLVYEQAISLDAEIFILRVVCGDEEEIKRRLKVRKEKFGSSPFHETPSWEAYLSIKEITEPVEEDIISEGKILNIIEYGSLTKKARLIQGDEKSENTRKILEALNSEKIMIQDKDFNFIVEDYSKIHELVKNKFVIALDFDGVVTYPHTLKTQYINKLGYSIREDQSSRKSCLENLGIKKEHYESASVKAYTESPEKLPLEKGFIDNFSKLRKLDKVAIIILTSRFDHMIKHMQEYLKFHNIKVNGIINVNYQNKIKGLKKINAKIFVEDTLFRIEEILEQDPEIHKECSLIYYRNQSNRNFDKHYKEISEVNGWQELFNIILEKYKKFIEGRYTQNIS